MTFAAREESRYRGKPVDLYLFIYGDNLLDYIAYTDAEQEVTWGGKTYTPIPIKRGAINSSGTLDRSSLEIRTPQNTELADLFVFYPPSRVVTLIIWQGHIDDPDEEFLAIWTGRVLGCKRQVNEASYTCEPVSTSLRRAALRRNYQYGCPHVLYGPMCRANKEAATTTTTVMNVDGPQVEIPNDWPALAALSKYQNGIIEWTAPGGVREIRNILRIVENPGTHTVVMGGRGKNLSPGMEVKLILSCNHNGDDCTDLHNNILNYGGQPWIPLDNPIGIKNTFD